MGGPNSANPCWTISPPVANQPELPVPDKTYNVLFLCPGNSARSILAEAILQREGPGKFKAFSAGSQPKGEVHPYALDLLKHLNHSRRVIGPKAGMNSLLTVRLISISFSRFATMQPMRFAPSGQASR